jgi:hypothetical protein
MRWAQLQALFARAVHSCTPSEEARTSAMIFCRALADGAGEFVEPGTLMRIASLEQQSKRVSPKRRRECPDGAPREIRAKFDSNCRRCGERYTEGTRVAWWPSWGCMHLACAREAAA